MHWKDNYDSVVNFCREARDSNVPCWMVTIAGSTHLAMTDFAVLYPHWMSFFMKSMVDPIRALYLTTALSLDFLKEILPPEHTKCARWGQRDLLMTEEEVSDPDEALRPDNAPEEKWVAVRLKMHNEFVTRLKYIWQAISEAILCKRAEDDIETGNGGWDELWTHFSPEPEQLHMYKEKISQY